MLLGWLKKLKVGNDNLNEIVARRKRPFVSGCFQKEVVTKNVRGFEEIWLEVLLMQTVFMIWMIF